MKGFGHCAAGRRGTPSASRALALLLALGTLALPAHAARAEQRLALIIANSAYNESLGRLSLPARDAAHMTRALQNARFSVRSVLDADNQRLQSEVNDFVGRLQAAGADGIGFVYFSGHGAANRKRGENYLIPIDAHITSSAQLPLQAMPLGKLLDSLEATGARSTIVVIDACRNVPFADAKSAERGLILEQAKTDMLIAFATEPGNTASDDGVFAEVLAAQMAQPGATTLTAFDMTKSIVARRSERRQVPRIENGIVDHITFTPGANASPADGSGAGSAAASGGLGLCAPLREAIQAIATGSLATLRGELVSEKNGRGTYLSRTPPPRLSTRCAVIMGGGIEEWMCGFKSRPLKSAAPLLLQMEGELDSCLGGALKSASLDEPYDDARTYVEALVAGDTGAAIKYVVKQNGRELIVDLVAGECEPGKCVVPLIWLTRR